MARNKYPEETERLILETAKKLFVEKGYDNTSIQDIINHLGGLSKGAIYHHFSSKEEILMKIMELMDEPISSELKKVRDDKSLNGYEKLRTLFRCSLFNVDKETAFQTAPDMMKNPQMLAYQIESVFQEVVPDYILPILQEGIADGSIQTDYPSELAEVMLLLSNLWLSPLMFNGERDLERMMRRVEFYNLLFRKLGLELIDEEMMRQFRRLGECYYNHLTETEKA